MRKFLAAVMVGVALSASMGVGFLLGRSAPKSAQATAAVLLSVVDRDSQLAIAHPRGCSQFRGKDGARSAGVIGEVLRNHGPDAVIITAEFRIVGSVEWSARREFRVLDGQSLADVKFASAQSVNGSKSLPAQSKWERCVLFIEKVGTFVPTITGPPPYGPGAVVGIEYPYQIRTHCGVTMFAFDGRWWKVQPPLSDDPANPPPGWDEDPLQGEITLLSETRAEFRAGRGRTAQLVPRPAPTALGECN